MCRTITQFSASFAVLAAIRVLAALWMNLHRSSKDAIFCQITMHSGVVFRFSPVERFGLLVLLVSASLGLVKETEIDYCRQVLFEYVFKIIEMRLKRRICRMVVAICQKNETDAEPRFWLLHGRN